MKKALIFLGAFFVSSMVIYSVYYYKTVGKLDRSIVASADQLQHTFIGPQLPSDTYGNFVMTHGLWQAASVKGVLPGTPGKSADVKGYPWKQYLSVNGPYSRKMLEEFDQSLMQKYDNHPPVDFAVEEGENMLFSYYFHNIYLPDGFRKSAATTTYGGKEIRSLEYFPFDKEHRSQGVSFYKGALENEYGMTVELEDSGVTAIYYTSPALKPGQGFSQAIRFLNDSGQAKVYELKENERVVMPRIDLSLVKRYGADDTMLQGLDASSYKMIEERIKVKTSVSKRSEKEEIPPLEGKQPMYKFSERVYFCLIRKGSAEPYFSIYISNPELLQEEMAP